MSGIGDFLFGSEGEPGKVVDTTPDEFAGLRGPIASALSNLISSGGGPSFDGPLVAGMTDNEKKLVDQAVGQAGPSSLGNASKGFLANLLAGGENPFLNDAIDVAQRRTLENFQDVVMPRLRSDFTRAGQFIQEQSSSPFDLAAAKASSGLANSLSDIATNISFGAFENERNRQLEAAQTVPQIEAAELDQTIKGLQAAALPRLIEDLGIERGIEEFRRRVDVLLKALGIGGSLSAGQPVMIPGTEGSTGLLGTLLENVAGSAGEEGGLQLAQLLAGG